MKNLFYFLLIFLQWNATAQRNSLESFDVLHYRFEVKLTDENNQVDVLATIQITFPNPPSDSLFFDLDDQSATESVGMKIKRVMIEDELVSYIHQKESVGFRTPIDAKQLDTISISVEYSGVPANGLIISTNKHGDRTFFADHWPDRAHFWLPVIDHPSEKATCEFIVTAPKKYDVIANGDRKRMEFTNKFKTTHWHETEPISTKVMAIGVAEFIITSLDKNNFSSSWVYKKTGQSGVSDFSDAYGIYQVIVGLLGDYPFSKLDHVESTTIYGGMENAGCIFYNEKSVTGLHKFNPTIAHEIGHQWFGDAVTESDWKHVWLSEGLATYLENYYILEAYGNEVFQNVLKNDETKIMQYESKFPERKIMQDDHSMLTGILNPLTYEKAGWMLRSLEHRIGKTLFVEILKAYYAKYKYSNASTDDFIAIANEVSGLELIPFFHQWLDIPGSPNVTCVSTLGKNELTLQCHQNTNFVYDLLVDVQSVGKSCEISTQQIHLNEVDQNFVLKGIPKKASLLLDPLNVICGEVKIK